MNENCQKWHDQIKTLRGKRAEFGQAYTDALKFAEENSKYRDTAFQECRKLKDKIKPLVFEIKEEFNPAFKFQQIVARLTLSPDARENKKLREKLQEMASVENYQEAVTTAKELDPNVKVPTHQEIIKNLLAMDPEKLEKIARIMGKPGLIIVPDKSMTELSEGMSANRHYDDQAETYLMEGIKWPERPRKVSVSIMDMVPNPAVVPGQKPDEQLNKEQLRVCEKYFRDNGMRLANDLQYATGMQKSLRAYELAKRKGGANPQNQIMDFSEDSHKTVTIFNQEQNTDIENVASGDFFPTDGMVFFSWHNPDDVTKHLRGRGVVEVM